MFSLSYNLMESEHDNHWTVYILPICYTMRENEEFSK